MVHTDSKYHIAQSIVFNIDCHHGVTVVTSYCTIVMSYCTIVWKKCHSCTTMVSVIKIWSHNSITMLQMVEQGMVVNYKHLTYNKASINLWCWEIWILWIFGNNIDLGETFFLSTKIIEKSFLSQFHFFFLNSSSRTKEFVFKITKLLYNNNQL